MTEGIVKGWMALLLLMSIGMLVTPLAHGQTAAQMTSDCAPYRHGIVLAPRPGGGTIVEAPGANGKSDFCWGAFATLQQFAALQDVGAIELYPTGHPAAKICFSPLVQRLQLVKAFIQYMDAHPAMGNQNFAIVLLTAMSQAYPCANPVR